MVASWRHVSAHNLCYAWISVPSDVAGADLVLVHRKHGDETRPTKSIEAISRLVLEFFHVRYFGLKAKSQLQYSEISESRRLPTNPDQLALQFFHVWISQS